MASVFMTNKLKRRLIVCIVGIAVFAVSFVFLTGIMDNDHINFNGQSFSVRAETIDDHKRFAAQFGLKLGENPVMIQKVTIPQKFSRVYKEYNELQRSQGFDLEPYSGQKCIIYTYKIENENNAEDWFMDILVKNYRVIGKSVKKISVNKK